MDNSKFQGKFILKTTFGFCLFCLTLLLSSFFVHAESLNPLPYEVVSYDNWTNRDGYSMQDLQNYFNNRWGEYYPTDFFTDGTFVLEFTEVSGVRAGTDTNYTYVFVPSDSGSYVYADPAINYTAFDTSTDSLTLKGYNYKIVVFSYNRNRYNDPDFANTGFQTISITPSAQPTTCYSNILYNYYNNGVQYSNDVLIGIPVVVPDLTGHATQPNNNPNNLITGNGGNPISRPTRPTPTPFNPSVWNPPAIDTTNIESLLKSIWDAEVYGFNYTVSNISGFFTNLVSNLDGWFAYVVDCVYYTGNKIVQSIQDLSTDLYNNFVSLFEPLYTFFNGIATFFNTLISLGTDQNGFGVDTLVARLFIPDPDQLQDALQGSDSFNLISLSSGVVTKAHAEFENLTSIEPKKFIHVPDCYYHGVNIGGYDIDFSWYDNFKTLGDGLISAFLIFNYIFFLFFRLPSYIRGQGAEFNRDVQQAKQGGLI